MFFHLKTKQVLLERNRKKTLSTLWSWSTLSFLFVSFSLLPDRGATSLSPFSFHYQSHTRTHTYLHTPNQTTALLFSSDCLTNSRTHTAFKKKIVKPSFLMRRKIFSNVNVINKTSSKRPIVPHVLPEPCTVSSLAPSHWPPTTKTTRTPTTTTRTTKDDFRSPLVTLPPLLAILR